MTARPLNLSPELAPFCADAADYSDIITLMVGSADPLGISRAPTSKLFAADGTKKARQAVYFTAIQLHVPDVKTLACLLELTGSSPHAAICNGRFTGLPAYSFGDFLAAAKVSKLSGVMAAHGFRVLPKALMQKQFGSESGVHVAQDGRAVVARTNANTTPSSWLVLDRDIEPDAPEWAHGPWLEILARHLPGVMEAPRIETTSSSARVLRDCSPLSAGHGHVWVQIEPVSAGELIAAHRAARNRMIATGDCWARKAGNESNQILIPIDLSTWKTCGMVYCGQPEVESGSTLTVAPAEFVIHAGVKALDLADIEPPTTSELEAANRRLRPGVNVTINGTGTRTQVDIFDLTCDDEVELEDGTTMTLADVREDLQQRRDAGDLAPRVRMQSPLRPESRSCAAFAGLSRDGSLILVDSGLPGETHWIAENPADVFDVVLADEDGSGQILEMTPTVIASNLSVVRASGFQLLSADQLSTMPPLKWRIKHVLPETGLGAIYGPSGSGKSFLVLDMLAAVADGRGWHGYSCNAAPVVYVCLEGSAGLPQRLKAYRQINGDDAASNMHFVTAPFQLIKNGDIAELARVVLEAGGAGAVVCIDTLNQAAPGADENSSAEMGNVIAGAKRLQSLIGGLVLMVHHSGKDATRGLRGHSSLFAALDIVIEVTRQEDRREWKIAKAKDDADGAGHPFKLETVMLGVDDDMDTLSSCVAIPDENRQRKPKSLTPARRLALASLVEAASEHGHTDDFGRVGVNVEDWRRFYYRSSTAENPEAKRQAFNRVRKELVEAEAVVVVDDIYYPTEPTLQTEMRPFLAEDKPDTRH